MAFCDGGAPNLNRPLHHRGLVAGVEAVEFHDLAAIAPREPQEIALLDTWLYFKDSREIFSLTVMGQEIYVVTSASDIQQAFKESKALDHDVMALDVLADLGINKGTMASISRPFQENQSYLQATHGDFRLQMHPGPRLEVVQEAFLAGIDRALTWERISGAMVRSSVRDCKIVSLWQWSGYVLLDSAIVAFFNQSLYKTNPQMQKDFFTFDEQSWKLPYRLPRFAAEELHLAKDRCEAAIAQWIEVPAQERECSWIVNKMLEGLDKLEVHDTMQRARLIFVLFRVINSNAYRMCFWCLAYLLFNPALLAEVKEEMQPARQADGSLSMPYLLENCPLLSSFYAEVLRLTVDTIGARAVTRKVSIGGKVLLPGKKLLMPYRQGHFNPKVFGHDAEDFNPRRFMDKKDLSRSSSWKPFGGGTAWCPGRFMARREVYMFLGVVLFRYDLKLHAKDGREPVFPVLDDSIPYGGILTPKAGHDVYLEVRERAGELQSSEP
ncbi:Cytochrome P450 monooxygenase calL [Paramyrothecium foliicola]|nr:Cytochrome P450 monooxygenase calL [Paramyrothecium foliicola]